MKLLRLSGLLLLSAYWVLLPGCTTDPVKRAEKRAAKATADSLAKVEEEAQQAQAALADSLAKITHVAARNLTPCQLLKQEKRSMYDLLNSETVFARELNMAYTPEQVQKWLGKAPYWQMGYNTPSEWEGLEPLRYVAAHPLPGEGRGYAVLLRTERKSPTMRHHLLLAVADSSCRCTGFTDAWYETSQAQNMAKGKFLKGRERRLVEAYDSVVMYKDHSYSKITAKDAPESSSADNFDILTIYRINTGYPALELAETREATQTAAHTAEPAARHQ